MRERDRFGAELRHLAVWRESEYPESEGDEGATKAVRKMILVAGLDYPRYEPEPEPDPKPAGWKRKWFVLRSGRKTPLRYPEGAGGKVSSGMCLLSAEKSLKYDPKAVAGSLWRQRCLRLALQKLRADPDLEVFLYDLDTGLEERVRIEQGKLVTSTVRTFRPLKDEDYRVVVTVKTTDPKVPFQWRLRPVTGEKFPISGTAPYIRLFPFIHELGDKELDYTEWLRERGQNAKWLEQYAKSPEKNRYLGITDVYYHVEYIGKHRPYTLQELHLFGHASSSAYSSNSGTAFVNTDHVEIPGKPDQRNPLDLDARATLDFTGKTIDEKAFRMAFAKGARSHIWGCNWSRPLYDLIRQANDQLAGKKLSDTMRLKFRWRGTGGDVKDFHKLMKTDKSKVEVDGKFLRERLEGLITETYMQRIADLSSRCAIGGLPGTWSNYDSKSEKKHPCLLHIPMGRAHYVTKKTSNLVPILDFYRKHLGVSFDPEGAHSSYGRGFALFCPKV